MAANFSQLPGRRLPRATLLAAGLAFAAGVAMAAAASTTAPAAARANRHGVQIWAPIDPMAARVDHPPLRSTASYRIESRNCPPGTWRWVADAPAQIDEFDIASALIVRLELPDAPKETLETLARAAEDIAAAFRVRSGANLDDTAIEVAVRFPDDAHPLASVLKAWENSYETRLEEVARILAEVSPDGQPGRLRLNAIVARERVTAESAPIELCDAGAWKIHGYRAKSTQRDALPPFFFASTPETTDGDDRAADLARQLGDWLRAHYAREAAAGAILADGGDPSRLPDGNQLRTAAAH